MHHGGLVTGHGVVRIHGYDEEVVDSLIEEFEKGAFGGGVTVAHAEFGGEAGGLSEGGLLFAGGEDEGGAFGFPNAGVGLGGLFGSLG